MPKKLTFAALAAVVAFLLVGGFAPLQAQVNNIYEYQCDPSSCTETQSNVSTGTAFVSINAECDLGEDLDDVWAGVEASGCDPTVDLYALAAQGNVTNQQGYSSLGFVSAAANAFQNGLRIWYMTRAEYCTEKDPEEYIQDPTRCSQENSPP